MPAVTSTSAVGSSSDPAPGEPSRPRRRRVLWAWLAAAVVLSAVVAAGLWRYDDSGPKPITARDVDRAVERGIEHAQAEERAKPRDAATVYRTIRPSLVTITTRDDEGSRLGLGTGVVINADGAVITALHVVERAKEIRVRFADGTRASAEVASTQPATDIAVLDVDGLPGVVVPAVIGGTPPVGEDVFAVGNPLGLEGSHRGRGVRDRAQGS